MHIRFTLIPIILLILTHQAIGRTLLSAAEPDYPPFSIASVDGTADGLAVELLRATVQEMGMDLQCKSALWDQIKNELAQGDLDVLPLVGRTPERDALYDFSIPFLTLHGALFVREDTTDIHELSDLKGKRITVMKGDNAEEYVRRAALSAHISTTPTFDAAFRMLAEGRTDAVIAQKLMGVSLLKILQIDTIRVVGKPNEEFKQTFSFAVKKGNSELLAQLNEGLAILNANGTAHQIHQKWMGVLGYDVARARVLAYGGDHANPPFEFLDNKGRPTGFNIDLLRALSRQTGIDISFQLMPRDRARDQFKRGELDLMAMNYSTDRATAFDFSVPIHRISHAVFSRKDSPLYMGINLFTNGQSSVRKDDFIHEYARKTGLTDQLIAIPDPEKTLQLLSERKVDFSLGALVQGHYWIKKNGWKNLRVAEPKLIVSDYCLCALKDQGDLINLINTGLLELKASGEYRRIYAQWMAPLDPQSEWKLMRQRVYIGILIVLLLCVIAALWIFLLHRQVYKKTAELRGSEERFEIATEAAGIGVWDFDVLHDRLIWDDRMFDLYGATPDAFEGAYNAWAARLHPEDRATAEQAIKEAINGVKEFDTEFRIILPDGKTRYLRAFSKRICSNDGKSLHIIGTNQDITASKLAAEKEDRLNAQLLQARKMESIGLLAGGVAHDFNNKLHVILGYADIALTKIDPNDSIHPPLIEIRKAAQLSADLTGQLLTFARKQIIIPQILDLNSVIENTIKMLSRLIGDDVELIWRPNRLLWPVKMDPSQIDQILTNLCVNARDAINGIGSITIEMQNTTLDDSLHSNESDGLFGDYVMLSISDNGCGMDQTLIGHIFEPFFTSKALGQGTGLGLATIYGIVKQNEGGIAVDSVPNQGSTFKIYLPRCIDGINQNQTDPAQIPSMKGQETILLVEDAPAVLDLTHRLIETLGYQVLVADLPSKALQIAKEYAGKIDLLVTDVIMPGMNGPALAAQLQSRLPHLKCLFMSGYSADTIEPANERSDRVHFIQKPFGLQDMAAKLRAVLDDRPG